MVSAFVTDFPEESNETDDAAKLQEKYGGSVPQAKFTGPAKPPCGVTVKVTLAGLAKGTTYHYQVVTNVNGSLAYGVDQTFTTPSTTSSPAWHSAQLTALTNPNLNNAAAGNRTG